jgi:hypothetical protein
MNSLPLRMSIDTNNRTLVRVAGLCETFLLDAAVLVFVFPALDTLINFGTQRLTLRLMLWTVAISGVFFIGAVFMSVFIVRKEQP